MIGRSDLRHRGPVNYLRPFSPLVRTDICNVSACKPRKYASKLPVVKPTKEAWSRPGTKASGQAAVSVFGCIMTTLTHPQPLKLAQPRYAVRGKCPMVAV